MKVSENAPRSEITIQGLTFVLPEPYAEGHTLTAGEASALNQTYHENIRNNSAAKVKAAVEAAGGAHDKVDIDALQEEISAYALEYEFGVRKAGGTRVPADPVQREALKIAKKKINEALKTKGVTIEQFGQEKYDELVETLRKREDVQAVAIKMVEATKSLVNVDLQ